MGVAMGERQNITQFMKMFEMSADYTIYNDDFLCTPCLNEGNDTKAIVYCQECEEFYCGDCKSQHCRFGKSKNHVLIDKTDFDKYGSQPKSSLTPKAKCTVPNHFGTLLTIYCVTHRVDCCPNCAVKEHE